MTPFAKAVTAGEIVGAKPLPHGRNGAVVVTYMNGVRGVVKRRSAETGLFRGVQRREMHLNEIAAYRIDSELLHFGVIPETMLAYYNGVESSVQQFVQGSTAPDIQKGVFDLSSPNWKFQIARFFCQVPPETMAKIVLFDLLVNNTDRHGRNLIFTRGADGLISSGQTWAIDNGAIMGRNLRYYRNVFHKYMFRRSFDLPDFAGAVLSKIRRSDLDALLSPLYGSTLNAEECYARVLWIVRHRHALSFRVLSQKHDDKDEFPSYESELAFLRSENVSLVATVGGMS